MRFKYHIIFRGLDPSFPVTFDITRDQPDNVIERHGGEAETSRDNFRALPQASKEDVIAFLNNLVLFKQESAPAEEPTTTQPTMEQMHRMR